MKKSLLSGIETPKDKKSKVFDLPTSPTLPIVSLQSLSNIPFISTLLTKLYINKWSIFGAMIFILCLYFLMLSVIYNKPFYLLFKHPLKYGKKLMVNSLIIVGVIIFCMGVYIFRGIFNSDTLNQIFGFNKLLPYIKSNINTIATLVLCMFIFYDMFYFYYPMFEDKWLSEPKYYYMFIISNIGIILNLLLVYQYKQLFIFSESDFTNNAWQAISIIISFMLSMFSLMIMFYFIYRDEIVTVKTFIGIVLSLCFIIITGNLEL